MRHILIIFTFSLLFLTSPLFGQSRETGILYRWDTENFDYVWKTFGDEYSHPKFKGEILNGKPNGTGTLTYSDGKKYMGEWKNGEPNGLGIFSSPDGGKYEGEWENGEMEGQGIFTLPDGMKYMGEFKNGKNHGQGTFIFPDGRKWAGEFRGNKPWNITEYDKDGNIIGKYINGVKVVEEKKEEDFV
jgi:hypothetical protein